MTDPNTPSSPHRKPRHSLSSIDKDAMSAICAVCGPTDIYKATSGKSNSSFMCATANRQRSAAYRQSHPHVSHPQLFGPTAHVLSQVDDENKTAICSQCGPVHIYIRRSKNLLTRVCKNASSRRSGRAAKARRDENLRYVEEYKLAQGCKTCGNRESVSELQFHAPGRDRRADHISKLMRFKFERLKQELKKYEVLCRNCHDKVHVKRVASLRRKHKPLPFMTHTK